MAIDWIRLVVLVYQLGLVSMVRLRISMENVCQYARMVICTVQAASSNALINSNLTDLEVACSQSPQLIANPHCSFLVAVVWLTAGSDIGRIPPPELVTDASPTAHNA